MARVELGAQNYASVVSYTTAPAAGLALMLAPGANQLSAEKAVRAEISRLEKLFPSGTKTVYAIDTQPFITLSIDEVVKTLFEAIVVVFVVMFVLLQSFRATLIPTIAVPVALLGTLGVLSVMGYSINTLTMLAMVVAVGLLGDGEEALVARNSRGAVAGLWRKRVWSSPTKLALTPNSSNMM